MENKKKKINRLPDSFSTEEEAGAFWDANSVADYAEHLESVNEEIKISERIFSIGVSEDVFKKLQQEADSLHQPVPTVVDRILRKELKAA